MANSRICAVNGCGKKYHAHGFCSAHAAKFKRHGNPLAGRRGAPSGAPMQWILDNANYHGDDCLPWPFEVGRYGYGTVKHEGKRRPSSRVMCIIVHGEPPTPEHEAAHTCGNGKKACMSPRHLFWDTKLGNISEAVARGVNPRGERCHWAKLKELDIRKIRVLGSSVSPKKLAEMFGVQPYAIKRILSRERWGWLK